MLQNVAGEEKYLQTWPVRESNLRPSAQKSYTLPRRYKSRMVPQGSTGVLYTYTLWHSPRHLEIRPRISGSTGITGNETQGLFHIGAPNVTGEEKYLQTWPGRGSNPRPSAQKSNTLQRRYKSRLVPQGSTSGGSKSVLYTYTLWHRLKRWQFLKDVLYYLNVVLHI